MEEKPKMKPGKTIMICLCICAATLLFAQQPSPPGFAQAIHEFMRHHYVIPKVDENPHVAILTLVSNHVEVFLSTNDLLPEQVHVVGPDGKVYLSIHSDSFEKLKNPRWVSKPHSPTWTVTPLP